LPFLLLFSLKILPVLHSCHKLHYFKKAGWEDSWIEAARNIVHMEFDKTYAFMDIDVAPDTETAVCIIDSL